MMLKICKVIIEAKSLRRCHRMQTTNADGSSAIGEKVKTVDSIVVWPEDLVARRWKSSNL